MSTDTSADTSGLGGWRSGSEGGRLESRAGQASRAGHGVKPSWGWRPHWGRVGWAVAAAGKSRPGAPIPSFFLLRAESKCQVDVNTKV